MGLLNAEEVKRRYMMWLEAEEKITLGQEYEIDSGSSRRKLSYADLPEVRKMLNYWEQKYNALDKSTTFGKSGFKKMQIGRRRLTL